MKRDQLFIVVAGIITVPSIIFLICISIVYFNNEDIYKEIYSSTLGTFGDFVGGFIGTLFALATTILIYITYQSQKSELEKTSDIAEKQFNFIIQQQFETTFFNLISELRKIPDTISGILPTITFNHQKGRVDLISNLDGELETELNKGYEFFRNASEGLKLFFSINEYSLIKINKDTLANYPVGKVYDDFYSQYLDELDHFFRFFYNILKFIDNADINNKKLYSDFLQAQLSKYELGLIFYNGLGNIGKKKLFPLLEKYNFLENINKSVIVEDHYRCYPYTLFRFLPEGIRKDIVVKAIKDNPDKIPQETNVENYYLEKYNYHNDII